MVRGGSYFIFAEEHAWHPLSAGLQRILTHEFLRILIKVLENGFNLLYSNYGGKYSLGLVHEFEGLIPVPKPGKPLSPIENV